MWKDVRDGVAETFEDMCMEEVLVEVVADSENGK